MNNSVLTLFVTFSLTFQILAPATILMTNVDQIIMILADASTEESQSNNETTQEEDITTLHHIAVEAGYHLVNSPFRFGGYLEVTSNHTQRILIPPPEFQL